VVVLGDVLVLGGLAGGETAIHPVVARAERDRRHAALGEREVIGAEEVARFRLRIRRVRQAPLLGGVGQLIEQVELGTAGDGEVARRAVRIERIHVDVGHGGGERVERLGGVVLRTQQALLLGGHVEEHHRTFRLGLAGEGAGQLDQRGGAGRVVHGAVVDLVALGIGSAHAQVIPVRAVDHRLVRTLGAVDAADDVVRGDDLGIDLEVGREAFALQLHRLEVARLRLLLQCVEIQAGGLEQIHRDIALDPGFHRRMCVGRMVAHHVELGVGVGVGHGRPAVGGRCGLVDDQHAGRALAGGFLIFVGPAAVVGHRLAAEVAHAGFEVRIVDQHDGDLAFEVHALEVVPFALRRLHAVAHEHQRRILQRHGLGAVQRRAHGDLLALGEALCLAVDGEGQRRCARDIRLQQRHRLGPFALAVPEVAAGLHAGCLELRDHVIDGLLLAGGGGATAFEGIGGKRLDVVRQSMRIDGRGGRGKQRRRHGEGEQG